ncbi:MAG: mandelate racemase/muconate lactonizing enzyme family protein, partial [Candidatus Latescibacterota bacterium]|nr:mandelate racemase/muconate lactonizing enzyme family protein [Candidatus Latescibacterota bacterium]
SSPSDSLRDDAFFEGFGSDTEVRVTRNGEAWGRMRYRCGPADGGGRGSTQTMAQQLIGQDPRDVDACFEGIRRSYIFRGGMAGLGISALTGLEIALWDLAGKAQGVPVYRLLGGKFRDRVRLYVDSAMTNCQERAEEARSKGFTAIKFDLDDAGNPHKADAWNWSVTPGELKIMVDQAHAIREAVGPHMDLAIDLHGRYDATAGMKIAHELEDLNLMWLEEPVPPENIQAMANITHSTKTPICAGENAYLRYGFREIIEKQAVDIIMPDISKCGGLSECRKIANMAETYYIPFAPHNNSSALSTVGDAHVCASVPNFLALEFHRFDDPTWNDVVNSDEAVIQDGHVAMTEAPGLGVELNEEFLQSMLEDDEPLWQ